MKCAKLRATSLDSDIQTMAKCDTPQTETESIAGFVWQIHSLILVLLTKKLVLYSIESLSEYKPQLIKITETEQKHQK